jgi:FMN phosphatase YigB (HAD superfamily)
MNRRFSIAHFILVSLLLLSCVTPAKDFIFDFGGVLIETNKRISFSYLGMYNVAEYAIRHRINPFHISHAITTTLFTILDNVAQEHNLAAQYKCDLAYDEKGNQLPLLMCAWLQGIISCTDIKILIYITLNCHPEWFSSPPEKRIITNLIDMIFTPEHFIASRTISPAAVAFIKRCKKEGHKIYGLSNWDPESFALLKSHYPDVFDLFDGIVISGHIHANKPHPTIYHALLTQYNLNPAQCWFVDDQAENVLAAQKLGINAVVHTACFKKLVQNIRLAHSKSVTRRENFKNNGIIDTTTNSTISAIIDGENISLTDSTKYNLPPANA